MNHVNVNDISGGQNVSPSVKGIPVYRGPRISCPVKQTSDSPTIKPGPTVYKQCFEKLTQYIL